MNLERQSCLDKEVGEIVVYLVWREDWRRWASTEFYWGRRERQRGRVRLEICVVFFCIVFQRKFGVLESLRGCGLCSGDVEFVFLSWFRYFLRISFKCSVRLQRIFFSFVGMKFRLKDYQTGFWICLLVFYSLFLRVAVVRQFRDWLGFFRWLGFFQDFFMIGLGGWGWVEF